MPSSNIDEGNNIFIGNVPKSVLCLFVVFRFVLWIRNKYRTHHTHYWYIPQWIWMSCKEKCVGFTHTHIRSPTIDNVNSFTIIYLIELYNSMRLHYLVKVSGLYIPLTHWLNGGTNLLCVIDFNIGFSSIK